MGESKLSRVVPQDVHRVRNREPCISIGSASCISLPLPPLLLSWLRVKESLDLFDRPSTFCVIKRKSLCAAAHTFFLASGEPSQLNVR